MESLQANLEQWIWAVKIPDWSMSSHWEDSASCFWTHRPKLWTCLSGLNTTAPLTRCMPVLERWSVLNVTMWASRVLTSSRAEKTHDPKGINRYKVSLDPGLGKECVFLFADWNSCSFVCSVSRARAIVSPVKIVGQHLGSVFYFGFFFWPKISSKGLKKNCTLLNFIWDCKVSYLANRETIQFWVCGLGAGLWGTIKVLGELCSVKSNGELILTFWFKHFDLCFNFEGLLLVMFWSPRSV